jgi:hypothetical protein
VFRINSSCPIRLLSIVAVHLTQPIQQCDVDPLIVMPLLEMKLVGFMKQIGVEYLQMWDIARRGEVAYGFGV